ncbi:Diacylglycerol kinase [Balamuthia mandrillaris]
MQQPKEKQKEKEGSFVLLPSSNEILLQQQEQPRLLIFVNSKSGGQQGAYLLPKFQALLPASQVFDIVAEGGPRNGILQHMKHGATNIRILACGGDGTGKWVLETMDNMALGQTKVTVAMLPLGTGNDIGRVLGWGGGYTFGSLLQPIIAEVMQAKEVPLDRWRVQLLKPSSDGDEPSEVAVHSMNNYLSLGFADAKVALDFHNTREKKPHLFINRGINKLWYASYGLRNALQDAFQKDPPLMNDAVEITVDGQKVVIPESIQGVVVLNLPSYAGGMNLWGTRWDAKYSVVSMSDGVLEVIGIRNVIHMAQTAMGMDSGVRLAQGKDIQIHYKSGQLPLPCKVDGEPWLQEESVIFQVNYLKQSLMLCHRTCASSHAEARMRGWMTKRGAKVQSWRVRWFILCHAKLYYYVTPQDVTPRGMVQLNSGAVVYRDKEEGRSEFSFAVHTDGRKLLLVVDSEEYMTEWMDAIKADIESIS